MLHAGCGRGEHRRQRRRKTRRRGTSPHANRSGWGVPDRVTRTCCGRLRWRPAPVTGLRRPLAQAARAAPRPGAFINGAVRLAVAHRRSSASAASRSLPREVDGLAAVARTAHCSRSPHNSRPRASARLAAELGGIPLPSTTSSLVRNNPGWPAQLDLAV
jgi:hypothetical protein